MIAIWLIERGWDESTRSDWEATSGITPTAAEAGAAVNGAPWVSEQLQLQPPDKEIPQEPTPWEPEKTELP